MKIVFIRHGEPDKAEVDKRGFIGQGRDMAPLTELGIKQAEEASLSPLLENCQVIVSSPYTRALQTAAIISKNTGLDIKVEVDIHEFIPDKTFQVKGEDLLWMGINRHLSSGNTFPKREQNIDNCLKYKYYGRI